jgi:hypothetical protein
MDDTLLQSAIIQKTSPFMQCIATRNNHDLAIVSDERQHCRMTIVAMVFWPGSFYRISLQPVRQVSMPPHLVFS